MSEKLNPRERGMLEMYHSMLIAVQEAGGATSACDLDMTVGELLKLLGSNNIRFRYERPEDTSTLQYAGPKEKASP